MCACHNSDVINSSAQSIVMSSPEAKQTNPDSKVHEAYMGPTWGRQDPGGPHVGPMNLVIREVMHNADVWKSSFGGFIKSCKK